MPPDMWEKLQGSPDEGEEYKRSQIRPRLCLLIEYSLYRSEVDKGSGLTEMEREMIMGQVYEYFLKPDTYFTKFLLERTQEIQK